MRTVAPEHWVSTPGLMARTGITYRQADYWTRMGWLRPPHPLPGSGAQRYYPPAEVVVAYVMGALVRGGVEPQRAALAARTARIGRTYWRTVLDGGLEVSGRLPEPPGP